MVSINLIVEDKQTLSTYKNLLESKSFNVSCETILNEKNTKSVDSLNIIDIKSNMGLKLLDNIMFKDDCYVIIISPFMKNFFTLPQSLNSQNIYYVTKPINFFNFEKILNNCISQIKKNSYLKSKKKILIKSIDDSPLSIAIYDLEGFMLYANSAYISQNRISNVDNFKFSNLINCNVEFKDIVYNVKGKQKYTVEKKQNELYFNSVFYSTEDNSCVVHVCNDETKDKLHMESLKKSAQFFEQSSEGAIITDQNGIILATNSSFCNITGYTKDEAVGESTKILSSGTHEKSFYENMWDSLKHYGKWQGEIWNKRKNGEIYPEWLSITKLINKDSVEQNYMAIFTDITSLKEADKKLHFYANYDYLTGLLNRVQFENMLDQVINSAVRNNKKFALLFIDLDYFKDVNDTAGHNIGDLVLKEVASRFQKTLRKEDIISRIGGDEFNVIIENITDESDAILLANKLNEVIKKPFYIDGKNFYLSLSIGISIFPIHGLNSSELSKNADSAMYEVKRNGRDGVLLYNRIFTDQLMKKVSLHRELKSAIKNEELEVYYQLVVDIETKKVIGAEALIRWEHHKRGFISPEEFIHIAEHHGLIDDIGRFVFRKACENLPSFMNKFGKNFTLAINVSSKEFARDNYVEEIFEIINDFHVSPENIELEITETYIMQNHTLAIDKMKTLVSQGFNLAIDDFGTGYSSLSYLKKFPINKIKIDKSFVLDIIDDKDDQDMVKAIINIANIFNLTVQAEGVETYEHFEILKANGADIAQGYFYSKPQPIENILSKEWS